MKETIIRNVQDIDDADRRALEHVLGQTLRENQQVMIHIISLAPESPATDAAPDAQAASALPDWCQVYEGLTDTQVSALETVVLNRATLTRP